MGHCVHAHRRSGEEMVRGHAKEQAQQKNAAKKEKEAKKGSNLGAGAKKTQMVCPLCKVCTPFDTAHRQSRAAHHLRRLAQVSMINYHQMQQHYDCAPRRDAPARVHVASLTIRRVATRSQARQGDHPARGLLLKIDHRSRRAVQYQ